MKLSPGHPSGKKYCILQRTLYGLKQSPREWYAELARALEDMGFIQNPYDNSLFTHREMKIAVIIYVDDLLLIGSDIEKIRDLKRRLGERFDMKDLGPAACFLGMQIDRNRE